MIFLRSFIRFQEEVNTALFCIVSKNDNIISIVKLLRRPSQNMSTYVSGFQWFQSADLSCGVRVGRLV